MSPGDVDVERKPRTGFLEESLLPWLSGLFGPRGKAELCLRLARACPWAASARRYDHGLRPQFRTPAHAGGGWGGLRDLLGSLTPWRRPDSRLRGRSLGTSALGKSEGSAGALSTLNSNPQARASTGNWLRGGAGIALSWFLSKDISCLKFWVLGVRRNPQQRSQDHSEGSRGCRECGPRGRRG